MHQRPSYKEVDNKLRLARQQLKEGEWFPVNLQVFAEDCNELNLYGADEQLEALIAIFSEITPLNYIGPHPPQKAYEKLIEGRELFEFLCHSKSLNERIYLKFAFLGKDLYIVSFHKSRR